MVLVSMICCSHEIETQHICLGGCALAYSVCLKASRLFNDYKIVTKGFVVRLRS